MSWLKPRLAGLILAGLAATPACAALSSETGAFVFQTYPPKAYGANPQNWAVAQDSRGVMYFGNTDGVLEFDGVSWRLIRLTYGSAARALAVDARGRIYVGGRGVFGYLAPDTRGSTQFVPINVPKADADFLDVWDVLPTSVGVYFSSNFKIFLYSDNGELKVWRANANGRFGRAFSAYGELFATTSDLAMRRLQGDEFVAGPTGDAGLLHGPVLFAAGDHPLIASNRALFRFALSEIVPFTNAASDYLNEHHIYSLKQLSSGEIAVGTGNGGLVLLNQQGELERIVRQENGLASDWVTGIYEDRQHGIWLATDNGLTRFEPGISSFGEAQGIVGTPVAEARFGGALYVGTTRGAFRMRTVAGGEPIFEQIKGIQEQTFILGAQGADLFAGGEHGLYRIAGGKAERLTTAIDSAIYDMDFPPRTSDVIYTAGLDGVRKWQRAGQTWKPGEPVGVKGQEFRTVIEDNDGSVWSTTGVAIWHIDFSGQSPSSRQFTSAEGVPAGGKNAYFFRGQVVIASEKGLLRFSEKTSRFEPDDELGAAYTKGNRAVSIVREDSAGNIWITGNSYHDFLEEQPAGGFRIFSSPLIRANVDELWSIYLDADGTCWASGAGGSLIRFEKLDLKKRRQNLAAMIRRVTVIGRKESLFEGDGRLTSPPSLEYRDNALRFEFAAPFYEAPGALEYQFRLDGDEKKWSDWTKETHKDYTNLFERSYRFHVRVRDPHGAEGGESVFDFTVRPPFYRTWGAYFIYVFVFLFAGWLILRWRLTALKEKNRWLENVVEVRTAEVRQERDQNEALLLNILPGAIAAELRTNKVVKPATFDDVTVCFSDFVGFTLSSEKMPAKELITSLNEYFTVFDEIIGRYGLEKLKTIGDAYMFAGGLPSVRSSHAVDSVLAALEMAAAVNRLTRPDEGVNWKIRLGLYSGPVVAGVVGVRKFAFDIWGNTVNFAARMESAGAPGRVNLSETTYQKVERFIECEPRGAVPIKEGRKMEMFFAMGPRLELIDGPLIEGVPQAFRVAYEKAFGEPPKSFPAAAVLDELQRPPLVAPGESK